MFDTEAFLKDQFGNPDAIVGLANINRVVVPERDTIRKWFQRGRVSGEWWPTLFHLAQCNNTEPISMAPYFAQDEASNDIFG